MKLSKVVPVFLLLVCSISKAKKIDYTQLGYYRVAAIVSGGNVGDIEQNTDIAIAEALKISKAGVHVAAWPELNLTKYTAGDLFSRSDFLQRAHKGVAKFARATQKTNTMYIIGSPFKNFDGRVYNVAFVIRKGKILGAIPKSDLPNYGEFYEKRYFKSGKGVRIEVKDSDLGSFLLDRNQLFRIGDMVVAVEVCEDGWGAHPPHEDLGLMGANVVFNISGSNSSIGKAHFRRQMVSQISSRNNLAYIYVSSGPGESGTDLLFDGHAIISENGTQLVESERYSLEANTHIQDIDVQYLMDERIGNITNREKEPTQGDFKIHDLGKVTPLFTLNREISRMPFLSDDPEEIFQQQVTAVANRIVSSNAQVVIAAVSGGLDSSWMQVVGAEALKKLKRPASQLLSITMPGFGTSSETKSVALELADALGATSQTISIVPATTQHFLDIGQDLDDEDITFQNAQARERTQIGLDIANKNKGIFLGPGNLSELCYGWCTFNGDHISNYGFNKGLAKTMERVAVRWYADHRSTPAVQQALMKSLGLVVGHELLRAKADGSQGQSTDSVLGPEDLRDFFIFHFLRRHVSPDKLFYLARLAYAELSPEETARFIEIFLDRFQRSQFKRNTSPPGLQSGSVDVSPRGKMRLPDEMKTPTSCTFSLSKGLAGNSKKRNEQKNYKNGQ